MSRFQFVADNSATFEVKRLCELVEVERSSFYAWLKASSARQKRARADAVAMLPQFLEHPVAEELALHGVVEDVQPDQTGEEFLMLGG